MNRPDTSTTRVKWNGVANVLLILLGSALATMLAGRREMWLDEYHTWYVSQLPLPDLYRAVAGDAHPPLYFVLMRGWALLFGDAELSLRSFSLLCHLAASVTFVALARRISTTDMAATIAIGLFALSPALVLYATEVRMYALIVLLACLTLWQFVRVFDAPADMQGRILPALLVALGALLVFLTHYSGLFFVGGLWSYWGFRSVTRRTSWRPFLAASLLLIAGILAWAPVLITQRSIKTALDLEREKVTISTAPVDTMPSVAPTGAPIAKWMRDALVNSASIAGGYSAASSATQLLFGAPFLLVGFGVLLALRARDPTAWCMALIVLSVAAGGLVIPTSRRYMLVFAPALMLLMGRGVDILHHRWRRLAVGASFTLLIAFGGVVRMLAKPTVRPIASIVQAIATDSSNRGPVVLLSNYAEIAVRYHTRNYPGFPRTLGFPVDVERWWGNQPFQGWGVIPVSADSTARWLTQLKVPRGWFIQYDEQIQDPWGYLPRELRRAYVLRTIPILDAVGSGWVLSKLERR
jgi:hypothetical protein